MAQGLEASDRRELLTQLWISRVLSPLWIPLFTAIMVFVMRWRIEGADRVRADYARLRSESDAPVLVCANHLTMFDSFAIAWSLGGLGTYLRHFSWLPWNTPETVNFASTWWKRALVYLLKCVPVKRGSDRGEVAKTLDKVGELLRHGESVLIYPEGGRSRTGRVDTEAATYGTGRLVSQVPPRKQIDPALTQKQKRLFSKIWIGAFSVFGRENFEIGDCKLFFVICDSLSA